MPGPKDHLTISTTCHGCAAGIGEKHAKQCDVGRCLIGGGQYWWCSKREHDGFKCKVDRWTGLWPGTAEAVLRGWYAKLVPGHGWVETTWDDPDGVPDLNRVVTDTRWDRDTQTHVDRN